MPNSSNISNNICQILIILSVLFLQVTSWGVKVVPQNISPAFAKFPAFEICININCVLYSGPRIHLEWFSKNGSKGRHVAISFDNHGQLCTAGALESFPYSHGLLGLRLESLINFSQSQNPEDTGQLSYTWTFVFQLDSCFKLSKLMSKLATLGLLSTLSDQSGAQVIGKLVCRKRRRASHSPY